MTLIREDFLSSDSTVNHGESARSVNCIMVSLARE